MSEGKKAGEQLELITFTDPKSPVVEAYHALRTNILFSGLDNPVRSILVTGALPGSGKSATAANLSVTIARTGAKVIMVDSDLRRPYIHKLFDLENDPGLTNLLVDDSLTVDQVLKETQVPNLFAITSGPVPPNPSELIVSRSFKNLMESFKEKCDYLLVDSPPMAAVTDAALLSRYVDGTLLVIDFGKVPREVAQKSKEQLENVQARVLGVVLSKIPPDGGGYGYYYYYRSYYGEEAGDNSQKKRKRKKR